MDRRQTAVAALAAVLAVALLLPNPGSTEARRPTPTPAPTTPPSPAQVSIYGAWHGSDHFCTWRRTRTVADFDAMNALRTR